MNDIIHLLPDSVANQIAAGEVIQRPSSVIKELVENAVDAGATDIQVFIKDAGRTLIQVVDNGKGMSPTDARMAFERHATSKIRRADDLFSLHTMGFRGEALPSICAISRVELKSRREEDAVGTSLIINGTAVESQSPTVCDKGTNIMVKNLFYNVPARRKFLKSDNVELANVMREFERLALVNHNIRMGIDTGSRSLQLRAGSFKQRITELWKNNLSPQLLPVEIDTEIVKVSGFISRPEFARRRNALQFLIVNGRNMVHPVFRKAVISCYDSLIAPDTLPCFFLKFEVDPASIDVNISPTKSEIKFENEHDIRPLLVAAVRASLGKNAAVPSIDFDAIPVEVNPLSPGEQPHDINAGLTPGYNPFNVSTPNSRASSRTSRGSFSSNPGVKNWDALYSQFINESRSNAQLSQTTPDSPTIPEFDAKDSVSPICMQYALKYIVTSTSDGILIIDQHRAHVKILFEEFLSKTSLGVNASQRSLFPEVVHLDAMQAEALREVKSDLAKLGFVLEPAANDSFLIVAAPDLGRNVKAVDVVLKVLDSVCEDSSSYGKDATLGDEVVSRLALIAARTAAIERGRHLSEVEMENIVSRLFRLPDPSLTPNGNLIYYTINESRIESLLK
ncbi:MAG: DNA mismatch repair endonuclease MutL [Clostridium sp.]|nr:DNA mismatch repair endonuclease MutL [Prevotella sp.]MCM1428655.1 DNA mismatch repair endonuclease MutL [Clostridium sp.]